MPLPHISSGNAMPPNASGVSKMPASTDFQHRAGTFLAPPLDARAVTSASRPVLPPLPGFAPAGASIDQPPSGPTRPRRIFSKLNDNEVGAKLLKFQQRKSLGLLTIDNIHVIDFSVTDAEVDGIQRGACEELANAWLAEQLGVADTRHFTQRDSGLEDHVSPYTGFKSFHDRNAEHLFHAKVPAAISHARRDSQTPDSFGLKPLQKSIGRKLLNPLVGLWDTAHDADDEQSTPPAAALSDAARLLDRGQGFVARMTILTAPEQRLVGRHDVSMYRETSGRLRFFDPNAGDYWVLDTETFINAWVDAYAIGRQQSIRFVTASPYPDGFNFYESPTF